MSSILLPKSALAKGEEIEIEKVSMDEAEVYKLFSKVVRFLIKFL